MTRILITGASGFIGTNLINHAAKTGLDVYGIDVLPPRQPVADAVATAQIDVRDEVALRKVMTDFRPEAVVHLAARTDLSDSGMDDYDTNTLGVASLVNSIAASPSVQNVLWASSRLVFAIDHKPRAVFDYKPSTQYGTSKVIGETIVRASLDRLPLSVIVRPTSIWGPHFGVPYRPFFSTVMSGRYRHPRGARPRKSFGYVGNTVHQILALSQNRSEKLHGLAVMLGDYQPLDLYDWANYIAVKSSTTLREAPISALRLAAQFGDRIESRGYTSPLTSFRLNNLLCNMEYDMRDVEQLVPHLPFTWQDGVDATLEWLDHSMSTELDGSLARHVW